MRRIVSGLAATALSVVLVGCGDGGEPDAGPSASGSPSASSSEPSEPSEQPSETVTPIDGVTRSVEAVSVTVPDGWKKTQYIQDIAFFDHRGPDGFQQIAIAGVRWFSKKPLDKLVREVASYADFTGRYRRLDDRTGPGNTPMFHIRGETAQGTMDVIGGTNATHDFQVELTSELPEAEHEAFVESVIPTIAFP